jgi:hypothetical protein
MKMDLKLTLSAYNCLPNANANKDTLFHPSGLSVLPKAALLSAHCSKVINWGYMARASANTAS